MNRIMIIGNLTVEPELRTTPNGHQVCNFSVAVNRRQKDQNTADFFRVSAWNQLAENCQKFLAKGRKVAVVGSVTLNEYQSNGKWRASMEVMASEVEFLSSREEPRQPTVADMEKAVDVTDQMLESLPF